LSKRLNKYISDTGFCSRREADKYIEQQRVTINGKVPELGTKVEDGDQVCVDGKKIKPVAEDKSDRVYIAYNKPIGITCTTERHVKGNIVDAINHKQRIFPIGRLDKPSEGLIFLTSDGDIVNKILRAENAHDKEYLVTVNNPISERFLSKMSKGVPILGTVTKPCVTKALGQKTFSIILTQGLNRQIRRMCEFLGYEVLKLKRVRIMNVELGELKVGQWRYLTESEMSTLNKAVAGSQKTAAQGKVKEVTQKSKHTGNANHPERSRAEKASNSSNKQIKKNSNRNKSSHHKSESSKSRSESPWKHTRKKR
jgi:23S rRNA pseudouridine2604 synthase